MLLEFRVKNFKSIKDEAVLSMVANTDKEHSDTNLISSGVKSIPSVVQSAVIYGPNASGKSNIIEALTYMRAVIYESATLIKSGQEFNAQPFRLDKDCLDEPIEFEISYIDKGVRHQYGFAFTKKRIVREWLLVYVSSKPQRWFNRYYDEETDKDIYELSSFLTGGKKYWKDSTRSNALFLSTAVQLNSEMLTPVFDWITNKIVIFGAGFMPSFDHTMKFMDSTVKINTVRDFLTSADIRVAGLKVEKRKGFHKTIRLDPTKGAPTEETEEREVQMPVFMHEGPDKSLVAFEYNDQSLGTQRLFSLAGPLLEILAEGKILIIDELDNSLHTLLVKKIIALFHSPQEDSCTSQLIFSTHDTSLLDIEIFRRDQIWFVEKDSSAASNLYPLTEFSPRKKEALERGYLMGRFGAVPFF